MLEKFVADRRNAYTALVTNSGHSTGSVALNNRLSEARAQSFATYQHSHRLHAGQYEIYGYTSSQPIASHNTSDDRETDRRVEFDLTAESREIQYRQ